MPDGDVFGERIDGCWRGAAEALKKEPADPEEVECEMERGLKQFAKQWLSTELIYRYAEILCSPALELTPFSPSHLCDQITHMSWKGTYGDYIVAEAAKSLVTEGASLYEGNLQRVASALVKRTCEVAAALGFISPAIAGALKQGRFGQTDALYWRELMSNRVSAMAAGARLDDATGVVRLRSTRRSPKRSTADLMADSLL